MSASGLNTHRGLFSPVQIQMGGPWTGPGPGARWSASVLQVRAHLAQPQPPGWTVPFPGGRSVSQPTPVLARPSTQAECPGVVTPPPYPGQIEPPAGDGHHARRGPTATVLVNALWETEVYIYEHRAVPEARPAAALAVAARPQPPPAPPPPPRSRWAEPGPGSSGSTDRPRVPGFQPEAGPQASLPHSVIPPGTLCHSQAPESARPPPATLTAKDSPRAPCLSG